MVENDHGWLNYYILPTGWAYLENFYIYPESRKSQAGTYLLSIFELELSELRGVKQYFTTINKKFGPTETTREITLKRGFKLHTESDDVIILKKEI